KTWLYPLALNRLLARRQREETEATHVQRGLDMSRLSVPSEDEGVEPVLIELMKDAIEAGFRACSAEDFVKLQLAHSDDLYYVELGRMFHCGKSTIERDVKSAKDRVSSATLNYIRER